MKKLVVWSEDEEMIDIKEFEKKEVALNYADMIWQHLTEKEKESQRLFVGIVDVDTLEAWKIIKKY